jgi:hypothetical protein
VLLSEWTVGRRSVRLVQDVTAWFGAGVLRCEWRPDAPRKLSKIEWRQYRAGRATHHQQLANIIGYTIAVAEL